ncbi:hypothetical protein [Maribellus maritimus]|uniref:hypothetical protein n=1 Tax=Maribellus maritimus TaxID=2870838 RepID=UPI001EE9E850|nr:hypothetical protein [Maribellus maritimus]MCG6189650.1 hypothetical protein [Maribellus maritimus]
MTEKIAKILSVVFHPVLVPTMGFLLLLNSGFYFSMISWEAKRFILLVLIFTTGVLPLLTVAIMALNPKFDLSMDNVRDRIVLFLFSSVFYYLGYLIMNRMKAFPVFKVFLMASVLVIILLLVISFKWKISSHMAAIGGISGALFALSFRSGINPVLPVMAVVFVAGAVGTARMLLKKHDLWQVIAGYAVGFVILYLSIYFV